MQFAALAKLHEVGPCSQNTARASDLSRRRDHQGRGRPPRSAPPDHRLPDPHDRRRRAIALTKLRRSVAAKAMRVARRITRQTLVPLSATE
jgi:MarR family transcriptional regulator, lower aerobic nicotinate degradation pathway regulator